MANQDAGERSEKATPKKEQKAKEKGQLPRSKELTTALLLITASLMLLISNDSVVDVTEKIIPASFSLSREQVFDESYLIATLGRATWLAFESFAFIFLVLFFIAIVGSIALGGWAFNAGSLGVKGNRLSPLSGFKRMFGLHALIELLKALSKVSVVGLVAFFVLDSNFQNYLSLGKTTPHLESSQAVDLLFIGLLMISSSLILIAFIDVPYQLWNHSKQLKMTKQEVKDEHKNTEGRPEVKSRIRQVQREMAHRRMMETVPDADVVVTNPEHYSVALKYDQNKSDAPFVIAKGCDEVAFNIRKVANAHQVPIIEAPPLARSLYFSTKLDHPIPTGLYLAVAQLLAYVFQMQSYKKGQAVQPNPIYEYPIPDELKR